MRILYSSLHNLDLNQDFPISKAIPEDFFDYMDAYVKFATTENDSSREYIPIDINRTVLRCVADIYRGVLNQDSEEYLAQFADSIALKLLNEEKLVQEDIGHMTEVQKGSIVQALLNDEKSYKYVIAKVEHSEWYDGETLQKNFGFPGENKRVWKSAVFSLDIVDDAVFFTRIKVYVNHVAKYWSAKFLEVQEAKTDAVNTRAVFCIVERVLKPVKKTSIGDYYNLRNTVLHELQSDQIISYPDMIGKLLDTYEPASNDVNVSDIKEQLLAANDKKQFDTQFHTDPKAIKRSGKIAISVSASIDVIVKEGIPNWKEEFLVHSKKDGRTYLMIRCDNTETLKSFTKDPDS